MSVPVPPEDKDFTTHDPTATAGLFTRGSGCGVSTEVRHDHPTLNTGLRYWSCERPAGHLGRHAEFFGGGPGASWARKR